MGIRVHLSDVTYPVTGPVLGVIGGGQLARMMAPAATNLGFDLHILAESPTVGAVAAVRSAPVGDYKDLEALREFARGKDVITFDHEHVPTEFLHTLIAEGVNVQPHPDALQYAQDKLMMRQAVEDLGLPNPRWARVETLDELKAKFRKELEESKAEAYDDAVETAAIEAAVANAEIKEIPEEMIHEEVHRAMNEFLGGMQQQGISPEMYFQITGTSEDDLHKQYEADADKRVRTNLVIEAIAAAENFTTSDEEVKAEIEDLAGQYNMPIEQVEKLLPVDMLKHDIAMKKAVEVIATTAKVK